MKNNENFEHCKRIAEDLRKVINGEMWHCPECGEDIAETNWSEYPNEDGETVRCCPWCHEESDPDEWEQITLYEYFTDVYDVEYRVGMNREYRSVRLMVACGGPNIYIDTGRKLVELHWWTDYAEYPLTSEICEEIDAMWEEMFNN